MESKMWIYEQDGEVKIVEQSAPPQVTVDQPKPCRNQAGGYVFCRAIWVSSWWPEKISINERRALGAHPRKEQYTERPGGVNLLRVEADMPGYGCGDGMEVRVAPSCS